MRISPRPSVTLPETRRVTTESQPLATPAKRTNSATGHRALSSFDSDSAGLPTVQSAAVQRAAVQPGIGAWARGDNAAIPLRKDDDGAYLGALGQPLPATANIDNIAGILPRDGSKPIGRAVFVNGIASTRGMVAEQMQQIADMTGTEVVGLYNATDGVLRDVAQTLGDRVDIGENKAVESLKNLILSKIADGEPLRLASYSQGALITSRALVDVKEELLARGLTQKQVEARLATIQVETFGGAASHYPDGPQYVHHVNRFDPVTLFSFYALGDKNPLVHPGRGAKMHTFNGWSLKPSTHSMATYLKHHVRYEELKPAPAASTRTHAA